MTEIGLAFFIGFMAGLFIKPKDKDLVEQQRTYNDKLKQFEQDITYYKNLCKWHAERKQNGN